MRAEGGGEVVPVLHKELMLPGVALPETLGRGGAVRPFLPQNPQDFLPCVEASSKESCPKVSGMGEGATPISYQDVMQDLEVEKPEASRIHQLSWMMTIFSLQPPH